jgi:hypothetical protein
VFFCTRERCARCVLQRKLRYKPKFRILQKSCSICNTLVLKTEILAGLPNTFWYIILQFLRILQYSSKTLKKLHSQTPPKCLQMMFCLKVSMVILNAHLCNLALRFIGLMNINYSLVLLLDTHIIHIVDAFLLWCCRNRDKKDEKAQHVLIRL